MANGITPLSRTNMQVDNVDFLRALSKLEGIL